MKKEVTEKETDTEMLARLVVSGFEKMDKKIENIKIEMDSRFNKVDSRFDAMDSRLDGMDSRFDAMDSRLGNIETEQSETNRRLASLEKKQVGTLLSLDETIHRNEFNKIVQRVEVLEKQ